MNASDYEKTLDDAGKKTSLFGDLVKANLTSDAIKSGVKKLASAVVEVGKASFEGYSQYEQLVGGVETLFKESAGIVQNYAKNAYKTAGLSANDYMSTVTSFSASLLQGLGNDTAAAAEYADMAITDMADNANKMGTAMEAIQNAYQGFAKQNYTMLDNLKLGYGGTKAEMERLLEDAAKIKAANGEMVEYSIDSFADMVEAIHVVQTEMDISGISIQEYTELVKSGAMSEEEAFEKLGTTAKEAVGTIEGSTNMMKAAWSNLATGMADETADMEQLTQDFVDSVGIAAKNIIPRVQQIVTGVGTATVEGISYLRETNEAIDLVVTVLEDVAVAAGIAGAGLAAVKVGSEISSAVSTFKAISASLTALTIESGKAAVAEATLNGTFSVGEIVVGVLTGKISLATAAQYAWNTAMNANPIGIVIALAAALGVAVTKIRKNTLEGASAFVKQADTAAECAKNLEELKARYAELTNGSNNPNKWARENREEIVQLGEAIKQTEEQLYQLTDAETAAAISSGELSAQTLAETDAIEAAAQTYADTVQGIMDDYLDTYESIYDGIHNVAGAFTSVTEATEITWAKAMENIAANTALLNGMDDNFEYISRAASDARIDISGFSEMLASMSTEDAAGLLASLRTELETVGPTSGEAAKTLGELSNAVSGYGTAGKDYSSDLAAIVTDVNGQIIEATKTYTDAVADLDQGAEAAEAGKQTMQGLANGIVSGTPGVLSKVDSLASQMKSRLRASFSGFVLNIQANVTANKNGSFKSGLDYVPFDGFIAELHKGERVLTAEEASAYRAGKNAGDGTSGIVINQYIQTPVETPAEVAAATEAYFQQARWAVAL